MDSSIEIIKKGMFYYCYNEDAIMLHSLLGYKLVSGSRKIGFPESSLDKVINFLEDKKINYVVLDKEEQKSKKDYKKANNYDKYCKSALEQEEIEVRFKLIERKIKNMSFKRILELFDLIENEIRK